MYIIQKEKWQARDMMEERSQAIKELTFPTYSEIGAIQSVGI